MKKVLAVITIFIALVVLIISSNEHKEYLRIHIRANSNSQADQDVKYLVKDTITTLLTPYLSQVHTKDQARQVVTNNLDSIVASANKVLKQCGYGYSAKAYLDSQSFPTRKYEQLTLEEGVYDALIIELGDASGDNWWCVVYPPLCFVATNCDKEGFYYKSKILEIINEFFKNNP
ncbi:MAG: stage II sporulation protein R [Clostridia bacterium]